MAGVARHFYKMVKENKNYHQKEDDDKQDHKVADAINDLKTEIQNDNKRQDKDMEVLKKGLLVVYKKIFMDQGYALLNPMHSITNDEYLEYAEDHQVYNSLGGNHKGDNLFKSVETKYNSGLHNN